MSIVNGLEKTYAQQITFVRANILDDKNWPLMQEFSFSATPEFYLLDPQGKIIGFWNDAVPEQELQSAFDSALREPGRN